MLYPTRKGLICGLCLLLSRVPCAWIDCHKSFRALVLRTLARLVGAAFAKVGVIPQLFDIHAIPLLCVTKLKLRGSAL